MTTPRNELDARVQGGLGFLLLITILSSIALRIEAAGMLLIFVLGIPLLVTVIIHIIVQVKAINKIPRAKPAYVRLILLSDLIFFVAFSFQPDAGDSLGWVVPVIFRGIIPRNSNPYAFLSQSNWGDILWLASLVSFVALIVTWILLARWKHGLPSSEVI